MFFGANIESIMEIIVLLKVLFVRMIGVMLYPKYARACYNLKRY